MYICCIHEILWWLAWSVRHPGLERGEGEALQAHGKVLYVVRNPKDEKLMWKIAMNSNRFNMFDWSLWFATWVKLGWDYVFFWCFQVPWATVQLTSGCSSNGWEYMGLCRTLWSPWGSGLKSLACGMFLSVGQLFSRRLMSMTQSPSLRQGTTMQTTQQLDGMAVRDSVCGRVTC